MLFMLLSGKPAVTLCSFFIAAAVLLTGGQYSAALHYGGAFGGLFLYYYAAVHILPSLQSSVFLMIGMIAFILQRIIPFLMLGTAIKKQKNLSEITTALAKCRCPKGILLSIAVMFRHFTSLKDDFVTIVEAMKLKGIDTSWKGMLLHPLRMLEYILVPMLFRSLGTAEEFSCAALVKGIEHQADRSTYFDVKIRKRDVLFFVLSLMALGMSTAIDLF